MAKYDFSGWATRNNLKCSDGRTIMQNAFADNDGQVVPLVWNHLHDEPENVLGHALLRNETDGVYTYGKFNDTPSGRNAKLLVQNGDITALSIYANKLKQEGGNVLHGAIREVSLVLSGANPGAFIDFVNLAHSGDGTSEEAIMEFISDVDGDWKNEIVLEHSEEEDVPENEEEVVEHAEKLDESNEEKGDTDMAEKTVQDVFDELTEEQKNVVYAIIGQAVEDAKNDDSNEEEDEDMKHNVFENEETNDTLIHSQLETILADGKRFGSLKESFLAHADEYGITDIEWLFPDHKNLENQPGFIKRNPDEWVSIVMNGVHHTPFSRIKMMFADLREDDARAKGYAQKGRLKKEEVFGLLKRSIDPTTIYKKQKLDRDDIIDITDFDVVSWLKSEMRMMLEEEIARQILFGDGRTALDPDRIDPAKIIPIASDAALYNLGVEVEPESGETVAHALIRTAVESQVDYEGSGNTKLFTSRNWVTKMLLMEDGYGRRLYKDVAELALAMNVKTIVQVPAAIVPNGIYGVIVDLNDYTVGADKGGSINMFDDFDIDYNQQKYLMETRCSGALRKPFAAITLKVKSE